MALNNLKCKSALVKEKAYKLFDAHGLYLYVKPNGSKLWQIKYRYLGREKTYSVGPYPLFTLEEAREAREKVRKLLAQDLPRDPMAHREDGKARAVRNAQNTFKAVALEWHENNVERWSKNYGSKVLKGFELNVFPYIGNQPISEITPPILLECIRKIEKRGSLDISARTKQICGQVFRYGIQTGKCERDASADLKGALKTRKTEHFKSMNLKAMPGFLDALVRNRPRLFARTQRAIWLSLYTFTRPGEIRQARWEEINFEEKVWIIPAHKMKMRRDHVVPLSSQAITVLKEQLEETYILKTEWVFPSQIKPKMPMSDGTVNKALKRLGYGDQMVAHGFRALARTTIREKLKYDSEIIEKQLAHKTRNPLGEAYDRTEFLPERLKMMQDWSDYIDKAYVGETFIKTEVKRAA